MKKLPLVVLSLVLLYGVNTSAQNANSTSNSNSNSTTAANKRKRGPVFRATGDQIKQAQTILKQRNLYSGDEVSKLTPEVRAALKEYQKAEGLKVTGTLNKATL